MIQVEPAFFEHDMEADPGFTPTSISIPYFVFGVANETEAMQAAQSEIGHHYGEMALKRVRVNARLNETTFKIQADYQYDETDLAETSTGNDYSVSFQAGTDKQKLFQSLYTVRSYAPPGEEAPDFGGAIEYDGKEVKGIDIEIPVFTWTEKHTFSDAQMTSAFRKNFEDTVNKVNINTFRNHEQGEVRLNSITGGRNSKRARWELNFQFSRSRNRKDFYVGNIKVDEKRGWDYMWVSYYNELADGELLRRPRAVYIECVYEYVDFGILGIGR